MGVVARLEGRLVDQIAAGEVVERPASVVKELLENALDAGATAITVEVDGTGIALVRVSDDGVGMAPEDALLCVERHATSKIRELSDLTAIGTLGFRGEALPSIASVSRFELVTRAKDALAGTRVRIDGGPPRADEIGAPPGTTVTVRDLFHVVPARRKFLKSAQTELGHVADVCLRTALSRPGLRLVLLKDGKVWREHLPAPTAAARARQLLPATPLSRIEGEREGVRLFAMLSAPERAQTGSAHLHVFVGGRPVRDRAILRAIAFGYGSVLSGGRVPAGVVHLDLDPARVDVNVHPQKAEVRFADARTVLDAVTRIVAAGMGTRPFAGARSAASGPPSAPATNGAPLGAPSTEAPEPDPWGLAAAAPIAYSLADRLDPSPAVADARPVTRGPLRFLAQLKRTFLLCESDTALVVLDQHAADERLRFDRLARAHRAGTIASQRMLLPERVELAVADVALLEERQKDVLALGLDLSAVGETTVAVRAVPALVARASPADLVRDLVAELAFDGARAFGDRVDRVLATMACHGSIRAGDALAPAEAEALVRAVTALDELGSHCPHGRPVLFETSFDELARRVGR